MRKVTTRRLLACLQRDVSASSADRHRFLARTDRYRLEEYWPRAPHPQSFLNTPASARLSSRAGFERQKRFLDTAEREGTLWYRGEIDEGTMRMGVSIVLLDDERKGGGGLRQEEIFGPVLPIIPVDVSAPASGGDL